MSLIKKKVSFDINPDILSDIKSFCKANNRKVSDFLRSAASEKIEREVEYLTIYVPRDKGNIEKHTIRKGKMDIEIFEASQKMKENVGASNQGVITIPSTDIQNNISENSEENNKYPHGYSADDISDSLKSCAIGNKIYFFTKEKYI